MKTKTNIKHNKHYRRNHARIIEGILKLMRRFRVNITCAQIARETGLARGTIRNHGLDRNKIMDEAEAALYGQFLYMIGRKMATERMKQNARRNNQEYFTSLLLFMSKRKRVFRLICEDENNRGLLRKMVAALYGSLIIKWFPEGETVPSVDSEAGRVFIAMAVELIAKWGQETGCRFEKSDDCLRELMVLADEMHMRCKL